MKFEFKKIHRNTPIDELIADLKNTAAKLNQDFVTREQQDEFGKFDSQNTVPVSIKNILGLG